MTEAFEPVESNVQLPRYQSHKKVWALKIERVEAGDDGAGWLHPSDKKYKPFYVNAEYMRKHEPQAGGYYVLYDDGYRSFSPAQAFEDGYKLIVT